MANNKETRYKRRDEDGRFRSRWSHRHINGSEGRGMHSRTHMVLFRHHLLSSFSVSWCLTLLLLRNLPLTGLGGEAFFRSILFSHIVSLSHHRDLCANNTFTHFIFLCMRPDESFSPLLHSHSFAYSAINFDPYGTPSCPVYVCVILTLLLFHFSHLSPLSFHFTDICVYVFADTLWNPLFHSSLVCVFSLFILFISLISPLVPFHLFLGPSFSSFIYCCVFYPSPLFLFFHLFSFLSSLLLIYSYFILSPSLFVS